MPVRYHGPAERRPSLQAKCAPEELGRIRTDFTGWISRDLACVPP